MITLRQKRKVSSSGALLLELLVAISLLAVILSVGANAVFLSMRSNKVSAERDVASALATEAMEAVRATADENWQNIYGLTKSSAYHPVVVSTKWTLSSASEQITVNGISYTRSVVIDNVSRDNTTRNIQTTYLAVDDDPGTQKVTVTVTWSGGGPVAIYGYFFRWKNKTCAQTAWTTGGSGNTVKLCTDASYDVKDTGISITGGIHLQ